MNIDELKIRGVFFHSTGELFCYTATSLACGLREMGIPIFANLDYCDPGVSEFAFQKTAGGINPAMLIVDLREGTFNHDVPYQVSSPHPNTHILAVCDSADHLNYASPYPIHRGHTNRLISKSFQSFPMAFGVSEKLRDFSLSFQYPAERDVAAIRNFRPSGNQYLRLAMDMTLVPILEQSVPIDRRMTSPRNRWDTEHLKRLGSTLMCLAYGGNFSDDFSEFWERELPPEDPRYAFLTQKKYFQVPAIVRWDSWRFWESITMGCLTIHLDFDKYGFELPIMPENWKHYIGFSLDRLKEDYERLMDEWDRIPEIASAGREWALEHYTPRPVAERFLTNAGVEF